ncbi:MAG: NAD(P)H-dependent glycerol-3-phosphate dehydrogenase [Acidimicrobiia bacterium]|nr:NAD(P)H-dependent glycerol-3-phosphate dehydrogenase [Acidimicrobiia bacterium]MYC57812.1 NAD(P)H-dependent glycerol-3-phosphate dehydrogenase [Acidimicrobiia bacterium]MYG94036.1 NAD(P)H-dependent glycerol-3-phosphate dehydrogenase [Acidimicrobiia bacterium]MYI29829.1 NAD(P)H-dependent glycerol-3-phosphate dehydrogenase [Acidimicrobiia bacterium]
MSNRVLVVGGGSWGTTVAHLAAHNEPTVLWCRDVRTVEAVNQTHSNPRYLKGFDLHPELRATTDLYEAASEAEVVVMAMPSAVFRPVMERVALQLQPWVPVLSLTKGLEQGTRLRMTEIINQAAPAHSAGALTGPNLAQEIIAGHAATSVIAMADDTVATALQAVFTTDLFRVYTNDDVVGCELGGTLKNVIALASGMVDGLGAGDNTRASVITRGLAEIARLGTAMGGRADTFAGLAGMGDLLATCMSPLSRNRHVGYELGQGRPLKQILADMEQTAEGVYTAGIVVELADLHGIEMPLSTEVNRVIQGTRTAEEAMMALMGRQARPEPDKPKHDNTWRRRVWQFIKRSTS